MLISTSKKFVFIANLKTASSSIERKLNPYADVWVAQTKYGKHMSARTAKRIINSFPHEFRTLDFFWFGVMRDPVSYILSLYNSHQHPKFDGKPISTKNMSFDEFLDTWVKQNPGQVASQSRLFINKFEKPIVNYIAKFEELEDDFNFIQSHLGIDDGDLPKVNVSPEGLNIEDISEENINKIKTFYSEDYDFYNKHTSRLL